jgi:hypothetical protein
MPQAVHCNACNSQITTPDSSEGKPSPQFLKCEKCGHEFFWTGGLTDNSEPLILFSIEDSSENVEGSELETLQYVETETIPESHEQHADKSGTVDTKEIVDLEINGLSSENIAITDIEVTLETPIEPTSQPPLIVLAENLSETTEAPASDTQSLVPEQSPPGLEVPQENVPQVERDLPMQLEPEPIVNDNAPESFDLELEIDSESDSNISPAETLQPPAIEDASAITTDHEDEPFPLIAPDIETEPKLETHTIEHSPVANVAASLDSSSSVDWSVLGPTIPRRRPKEASEIRKIIPPILGGLAAFPIATLILWYGFGKDIGTTGPTVAKYVPWIVPEKFRSMPFDTSPPGLASGRTQRSTPSTGSTLPTLNREETTAPTNDGSNVPPPTIAEDKRIVEPGKPTTSPELKAEPIRGTAVAKIPETLQALKSLQKEMENAPDNKAKMKVLVAIDAKLKELSKQSSELTGPSASIWNKQLETISRKILADSVIPGAIKKIANKARVEIPASKSGDFVATVIAVSDANVPSQDDKWLLQETWESDTTAIPVEVLPGAWRPGSSALPATCLVLGRLLPREDSDANATDATTDDDLVLKVHLLVPK